jgi:hypothetical protein
MLELPRVRPMSAPMDAGTSAVSRAFSAFKRNPLKRSSRRGAFLRLLWGFAVFAEARSITLDGRGPRRTFEGLGGLSAGAGSRLLFDYPEPERSQLLDFLFKPNFGAAFHQLKVEIGGDVNLTEGSEPSYARTRTEFEHPRREYFQRGYEWWLMREARKRNPKIQLDVLQWGAPDWIGDKEFPDSGDPNTLPGKKRSPRDCNKFFSPDNADFIARFHPGRAEVPRFDH